MINHCAFGGAVLRLRLLGVFLDFHFQDRLINFTFRFCVENLKTD